MRKLFVLVPKQIEWLIKIIILAMKSGGVDMKQDNFDRFCNIGTKGIPWN